MLSQQERPIIGPASQPEDALSSAFPTPTLEERLAAWLAARPRRDLPPHGRPAAVLVPLFERDGAWWVLLTRRTETVATHQGQICFPGGRHEPQDESLAATALRESHEEVGLDPSAVRLLGPLDAHVTVFGVRISPYLGVIPAGYPFRPQPEEVAALIELPFAFFASPGNRRVELFPMPEGGHREVHFFDRPEGPPVWGATARILALWIDALAADPGEGRMLLETLAGGAGASLDGHRGGG